MELQSVLCCSFDLYFRKNPFGGEYTVFGGLEECIRLIANFKLREDEIAYLRSSMPTCEVQLLIDILHEMCNLPPLTSCYVS